MAVLVQMPKLSDTMEEGGIASWLKEVGEFVDEGEALVEIETDKATMEYASPEEGYLLEALAQPGKAVALNAPICVLGEKGEKYDLAALIAELGDIGGSAAPAEEPKKEESPAAAPTPTPATAPTPTAGPAGGRVKASPLAKKIASDKGIDLGSVQGSGPNGRVIKVDVESLEAGAALLGSSYVSSGPAFTDVPNTMMRKTIAKRLLAGKNDAPHFYLTVSANMENMLNWRKELNAEVKEGGDIPKVSVNDLITLAVAKSLVKHPNVNASWQNDFIRQHHEAHISMAVALPSGLVTPVIRNAHALGVRQIAATAKHLGKKARAGELTNDDFAGGTFTISNLGMTQVEEFTAIINPPQAGILAVGRTQKVPAVNDAGELCVQQRMKMTLSCDHRVIDGMVGAQFLKTLITYLENPVMMLS